MNRLLSRLTDLQVRHPWPLLMAFGVSLMLSAIAILGYGGLGFRPDFSELLPDHQRSVVEMRKVSKRLPGSSSLAIVAEAPQPNRAALTSFVDRLVPRLEQLGSDRVGIVDYGVHDTQGFFDQQKLLFLPLDEVQKLHDAVLERYDYEVARRRGDALDEEPEGTLDGLIQRMAKPDEHVPSERHPSGYYLNREETFIAVLVRTNVSGKNAKRDLLAAVDGITRELSEGTPLEISYTGSFITSSEEYDAVVEDLAHVGGWGLVGILAVVFLFFLRVRTLLAMGITIVIALAWTFAITRFTIGYLNSSTGFLVSILAGNGINYGIMYMARYLEARRQPGSEIRSAVWLAHRDTWLPTLAGSATAMIAYGSLMVTDFRGFKHFGVISAYGMGICWLVTYLALPAVLVAFERARPTYGSSSTMLRVSYGAIFEHLSRRAPRAVTIFGTAATVACLAASAAYFATSPMEHDMRKVRNERRAPTAAGSLSHRVTQVAGRMGQDGMAIVVDNPEQVEQVEAELQRRWDTAAVDEKPFERVVSLHRFVPKDQETKLPLLRDTITRIERARTRGFLSDEEWANVSAHLPKAPLVPLGILDLPEQLARPFTEKNGTRGTILYIAPTDGFSIWDARYLMRWADSYREITLSNGEVIYGTGSAVIYADMIRTVGEDAPWAIALSAFGTIVILLVAFRGERAAWGVFLPWLLGLSALFSFLWLADIKLNFLNFVAIPITVGIGAEYAHNLMQRYRTEGDAGLERVVRETGGAVVLCSLTTILGYAALTMSINQGIASFGLTAAVGEVTCVVAAVLVLPSYLQWRMRRRRRSARESRSDGRVQRFRGHALPAQEA